MSTHDGWQISLQKILLTCVHICLEVSNEYIIVKTFHDVNYGDKWLWVWLIIFVSRAWCRCCSSFLLNWKECGYWEKWGYYKQEREKTKEEKYPNYLLFAKVVELFLFLMLASAGNYVVLTLTYEIICFVVVWELSTACSIWRNSFVVLMLDVFNRVRLGLHILSRLNELNVVENYLIWRSCVFISKYVHIIFHNGVKSKSFYASR